MMKATSVTPEYYVVYPVHLTLYWLVSIEDQLIFTNDKENAQRFRLQEALDIADELRQEYDRHAFVYRDKRYSTPADEIRIPKKTLSELQPPEEEAPPASPSKKLELHEYHLIAVLEIAIRARGDQEKGWGYTSDSVMLAVWKEMLRDLMDQEPGEDVKIALIRED